MRKKIGRINSEKCEQVAQSTANLHCVLLLLDVDCDVKQFICLNITYRNLMHGKQDDIGECGVEFPLVLVITVLQETKVTIGVVLDGGQGAV